MQCFITCCWESPRTNPAIQNSENKKEISKLISDVQTDMKDLTQLQKGYTGDRGELDKPFLGLIACVVYLMTCRSCFQLILLTRKLKEIRNECKGLTSKPSGSGIKRIYTHGNNIYNAKATEKKITKLRDSLRDAKLSFLVCGCDTIYIVLVHSEYASFRSAEAFRISVKTMSLRSNKSR